MLGGSGRFSERLMAIDDNGHAELLDELRDVRREIDSIPKKSELRLVAYVILGAVGSIFIFSRPDRVALLSALTAKTSGRRRPRWQDSFMRCSARQARLEIQPSRPSATYRAAVARWPTAPITLRQGARVVHESRQRQ
jgi:hypothetical protein